MKPDPRALREVGRAIPETVLERMGRATSRVQEESPLPADILESDTAYRVILDAPGATASDVQVQVTDGTIEVRIDRFRPFNEGFEMLFPGRGLELDGQVPLPEGAIDADGTTATLTDHGTLVITVPKAPTPAAEDTDEPNETAA
ncbi:Hsp20/alpha crystallin family protein [Halodesulfurarchaeum formicicum]|uniref:Hsp20/alpha crystallin family protein n=1 Tax=Halodesulfurarchaeum formicicum TaxID=1873524 RepID=UPI000AD9F6CC|nr:Hsp20/alpha crystallin family protein [Halodesulfurarchaeum formicicum]